MGAECLAQRGRLGRARPGARPHGPARGGAPRNYEGSPRISIGFPRISIRISLGSPIVLLGFPEDFLRVSLGFWLGF